MRMTPAVSSLLAGAAGFVLGVAATIGLGLGAGPAVLYLVLPAAFLLWHSRRLELGPPARAAADGASLAMVAVFAVRALNVVRLNAANPEEWDFQAFWLWGRAAALGLNPYLPESIQLVNAGAPHTSSFTATVVDVGFPYPPITMLLLRPFGEFDLKPGCVLWYLLHGLAFAAALWLLRRNVLASDRWTDLVLAAGLLVALRPTQTTVHLAQTNFLILLAFALYWRDRARARGGVWLALGLAVKPWVAILLLHPLVRRRWRVVAAAVAATAGLFLLAAVVFGPEMVKSYFRMQMVSRMPGRYFSADVNQSLLGAILRFFHEAGSGPPDPRALFVPRLIFLAIAGSLAVATAGLIHRLGEAHDDLAVGLTLALALLVYPGTLYHYGVMLIAPLLWLWMERARLRVAAWTAAAVLTAYFVLVGGSHARHVFPAIALVWCTLALLAARTIRGRSLADPVARPA
jgi:hypothetical protein